MIIIAIAKLRSRYGTMVGYDKIDCCWGDDDSVGDENCPYVPYVELKDEFIEGIVDIDGPVVVKGRLSEGH